MAPVTGAAVLHDGYSVRLWFFDRDKSSSSERDRREETLFIDAGQMGSKISRTQIELTAKEIEQIVSTYHGQPGSIGLGLTPSRPPSQPSGKPRTSTPSAAPIESTFMAGCCL